MVAVGGGKKDGLPQLFPQGGGGEKIIAGFSDIPPELPGDVPSDGIGAAEHFEGVETETAGFVLDEHPADPEGRGEMGQMCERRHRILGKALVETADPGDFLRGKERKKAVLGFGQMVWLNTDHSADSSFFVMIWLNTDDDSADSSPFAGE